MRLVVLSDVQSPHVLLLRNCKREDKDEDHGRATAPESMMSPHAWHAALHASRFAHQHPHPTFLPVDLAIMQQLQASLEQWFRTLAGW